AGQLQPDLMLMDIRLEGKMDGIEAADRIGEQFDIPVVFLTAYADEATVQRVRAAGAFGYLIKPFQERDLRTSIEIATFRHRSERALKRAEARFRGLLDAAPDAMVIIDQQGNIAYVNQQAERLFGYDRGEMTSHPIEMLMPERFRKKHVAHRAEYLREPKRRAMGTEMEL